MKTKRLVILGSTGSIGRLLWIVALPNSMTDVAAAVVMILLAFVETRLDMNLS